MSERLKRQEKVQVWARSSQKAFWQAVAERKGQTLAEWMRESLDRAAGEEMRSAERSQP